MEKIDVELPQKPSDIPTYFGFAVLATIINPPLGLLALLFAWECKRCNENGWVNARRFSDLAFAFCILAIVVTILILVFVYASGAFPDDRYYCRQDIIDGKTGDDIRKDPNCEEE